MTDLAPSSEASCLFYVIPFILVYMHLIRYWGCYMHVLSRLYYTTLNNYKNKQQVFCNTAYP